jgi:hypothetical protein
VYGMILSLTSFFSVSKGETDIWMVYSGTSSGTNAHLWAPWFALPTIYALAGALEGGMYMSDSDIEDMFLNFMPEERRTRLAGVDLMHYVSKGDLPVEGRRHLIRWNICLMRGNFLSYQTGKCMGHAKNAIMGDPQACLNVFQWKELRLDLSGVEGYGPSLSWAAKVREDGRVTADLFIYMDGMRPTGPDTEE